ncbi:MAG: CBS domain-containing protein [Bacteroidetes bacterium 4572_77]|nr:MAG: CBS domain-containing protein [Bacteroidetes bacterium 4572_77]
MLAQDLLTNTIVPLKKDDSAVLALSLMEEYKTTHLPIVQSGVYLGLISEADIYAYNQFEETIGAHPLTQTPLFIYHYQHIYDVIEKIHENKLSVVPVIDEKKHYLGSITTSELLLKWADISGINNPGGIIVLEMNIHDYSLSEIAQIVESNNKKIINSFVNSFYNSTKIEVTIKLNSTEIDDVLQTLNRYNYQVQASYTESDLNDNLSDRYDSLMNYLDI